MNQAEVDAGDKGGLTTEEKEELRRLRPEARAKPDTALSEKIVRVHMDSRETYDDAAPRIRFELRALWA